MSFVIQWIRDADFLLREALRNHKDGYPNSYQWRDRTEKLLKPSLPRADCDNANKDDKCAAP